MPGGGGAEYSSRVLAAAECSGAAAELTAEKTFSSALN